MSSEPPKPGAIPGWGQQPEDAPTAPAPEPAAPVPQPAPGTGAIPGWGQPPAEQPASPAPQPAAPAPQPVPTTPAIEPGPPPTSPPAPGTGAVPGWGQPPAPAPQPVAPAPQPGWGAPGAPPAPAPTPAPPPGGWGAPAGGAPGASGAPGGLPPGGWSPQPVQASGSSGCLKILLIIGAIGAILFTLLVVGLIYLGSRITESVGGGNSDGSVGKPCTFIDNATLSEVLGSKAEAIQLEGLWDATIGLIADKRVLPTADDCWITADESTALGRIAEYKGGDAAAVFQQERRNAQPTSQDQGGGVTLENLGYFAGDVSGLGDEAFCTGVDMAFQAGVLVRRGDTLLYVSLTGPPDSIPSLGVTNPGVVTLPAACATAQEIARRILR